MLARCVVQWRAGPEKAGQGDNGKNSIPITRKIMIDTSFAFCHTPPRSSHRGLAHDGDRGGREPRIVGLGKRTSTNGSASRPAATP